MEPNYAYCINEGPPTGALPLDRLRDFYIRRSRFCPPEFWATVAPLIASEYTK